MMGGLRARHHFIWRWIMYRPVSAVLSLGLLVLWIAGLAYHAPAWLTWLDGGGAVVAFVTAYVFGLAWFAGVALSGLLSLGLFVVWLVALAAGGASWLAWWNLGFAAAFSVLAVVAIGQRSSPGRLRHA
jgi:hypothetical protein